jgi:alkanesulfonate monooxygenase SsuD/methylene tetrahydromethanopterin reductase-like flavin-dependent oxidoreductase (luciferase family)
MHVGHGHFFQKLGGEQSDAGVWQTEMALADRAEGLGFDSVFAVEHHFADYSFSTDPLQFLTWVAARTTRVKLGSMVCVLPWHDPVRLAEEASVLDHLSGGRLIMGIGRGLARSEFAGFGVDMAQSRAIFTDRAQQLLDAFETGRIGDVDIRPAPLAPLRGRTYASSISPESTEIMARLGAGIMIFLQKPWEQTIGDVESYAARYSEINGSAAPRPLLVIFNACHADPARAEELFEHVVAYYRSTIDHYEFADASLARIPGYEYYGKIADRVEKHGPDAFARFLAGLQPWGTPAEVAEQTLEAVRKVDAAGVIVVSSYGGIPAEAALANQQRYAEEVVPLLRAPTPPDALRSFGANGRPAEEVGAHARADS